MKDKDTELERINNELFSSFDPEDESWLVGGSATVTAIYSFGPNGVNDNAIDYDWAELDGPNVS